LKDVFVLVESVLCQLHNQEAILRPEVILIFLFCFVRV
jgi:hypothetical protein